MDFLKDISSEKLGMIITGIVAIAIVIGISTDDSQTTINAEAGLEQCLIMNATTWKGQPDSKTIWVKDCKTTLNAMKKEADNGTFN